MTCLEMQLRFVSPAVTLCVSSVCRKREEGIRQVVVQKDQEQPKKGDTLKRRDPGRDVQSERRCYVKGEGERMQPFLRVFLPEMTKVCLLLLLPQEMLASFSLHLEEFVPSEGFLIPGSLRVSSSPYFCDETTSSDRHKNISLGSVCAKINPLCFQEILLTRDSL
jgi:hypothetical protein